MDDATAAAAADVATLGPRAEPFWAETEGAELGDEAEGEAAGELEVGFEDFALVEKNAREGGDWNLGRRVWL